jgi:hypothetical protein
MYKNKYLKYKRKYLELKGGNEIINWRTYKPLENTFVISDGWTNIGDPGRYYFIYTWQDYLGNIIKNKIPTIQDFLCLLETSKKTVTDFIEELKKYEINVIVSPYKFEIKEFINLMLYFGNNKPSRDFTLPLSFYSHREKEKKFYSIYEYKPEHNTSKYIRTLYENELEDRIKMWSIFPEKEINEKIKSFLEKNNINKMRTDNFWKETQFFIIGKINYHITSNDDIYIDEFISSPMEKGEGHKMLCNFLNLFKNQQNKIVSLIPANPELYSYYEKIGFTGVKDEKRYGRVEELLLKCKEFNS